jgi:uncharacterized protein (TIGR03437 family)
MTLRLLSAVLLALVASWTAFGQSYTISTIAGGLPVNVPGISASLYSPAGVAVDKAGNVLFTSGNCVFRLDAATGVLTAVAGNGTPGFGGDDGLAVNAELNQPQGLAVDSAGNLFIADMRNARVRRVTNGAIATVAGNGTWGFSGDGGPASSAQLSQPYSVAVDPAGNLFIADTFNNRIRKVSNGTITTVAGGGTAFGDGGPATSAQLSFPQGVAVDSAGNLYIADTGNSRIRIVSNGLIATVAGNGTCEFSWDNGTATVAGLCNPYGVAVDSAGRVYIADAGNNRVRKVSNGVMATLAGNGTCGFGGDYGLATSAGLCGPYGVAVDSTGSVYIADAGNSRVRKVSGGAIATIAGNGTQPGFGGDGGPASGAQLLQPQGVAVDSAGNLYIADTLNNRVRKVANGAITTVAGNGTSGYGGDNGPATSAQLFWPLGVAVDSSGNLYIADASNHVIRKVSNGAITTVVGNGNQGFSGDNGPALSAEMSYPSAVAVDSAGSLYIADISNHVVRKVSNGVIATVAGNGNQGFSGDNGPALNAAMNYPSAVTVDSAGDLYIADTGNHRIRKVSKGIIATVAGNGTYGYSGDNGPATGAQLYHPQGVAVDSAGNLYIADAWNNRIRRVANGTITTAAGIGAFGLSGDNGFAACAELGEPYGVATGSAGNVYIADTVNNRIRVLTPSKLSGICPGGVVPVYSSVPVIQPGSWVSIYGSNLAGGTAIWNGDFPMSLGGTSVTIDNKPAFLWYVSPTQINLQVPDDSATGPVNVAVTTASGTAASTVTLAAYGPSFSLFGDGKHVAGEIMTPNGTGAYGGGTYDLVSPSNTFSYNTRPVKAGETLVLYGVGFGPTTPHVPAGQAFSGAAPTDSPVTVTIGGVPANVGFSGLTMAGLYQINLTVPAGTGSGDQALVATINGVQTAPGPEVAVQ